MAKQELIPGGYYANETGARQFLVPGRGYLNENSANVFNETHTASLAGDFGVEFGSVTHDDFASSLTLGESWTAQNIASFAVSESLVTGFDLNPIILPAQDLFPGGFVLNESAARQFLVPGKGYVNDSGRTRTIFPVSVTYSLPISESLTGAALFVAANALNLVVSYPATLSDLPPGSPAESTGDSSSPGEAVPGMAVFGSLGTSGANPTYTYPYVFVEFAAGVAESLTSQTSFDSLLDQGVYFTEPLSVGFSMTGTINGANFERQPSGNDVFRIFAEDRLFRISDRT